MESIDKIIDGIRFSLFSPEMIRRMSAAKITVPDTYNEDGYPIDGGLVDQRMGVIDPGLRCKTCGGKIRTCPGHFTHIELVRPVVHPEFARFIYMLLRSTCRQCRRILISKKQVTQYADLLEDGDKEVVKTVLDKTRKATVCPHCDTKQLKIKFEKPTAFYERERMLLPNEIREMLSKISEEDLKLLGINSEYARPEWMIITALLVPPVTVRPSITLETGERSEDDLTHKLVDIMRINQRLEANINAGAPQLIIEDLWELLQYHVTTYFNNETANIPPARHRSGRPLKTLSQRLKGKEGRFRYNLSGKRVNFSARTVISPDPNISMDDVGVPMEIAEEMTIPIKVTDWNLEECKKLLTRTEYPKALYIIRPDGKRKKIVDSMKQEIIDTLTPGCTLERQLADGDTALFNRQPSLHRMSIMCHNVKIMPGRSFRINLTVCPPYNADFDGDEMNLHIPQTEEARVEAEVLMKVHDQIISPRHGFSIIKPQEDHVSGIHMLTLDDALYTKEEACQMMALASISELPKPNKKGLYTGKSLFSMLLPSDISFTAKTKLGDKVVIKDSVLLEGALDSRTYENDVIEVIVKKHGTEVARDFIDRSTRVALYTISRMGFSVGTANYTLPKDASHKIKEIEDNAKKGVDAFAVQYKERTLKRMPGRTLRETLEERSMIVLSKARDDCGEVIEKQLGLENTSILMAKIGSRGSILNAIQMAAMVGQQAVRGKRVSRGYRNRTLIHFKKGELSSESRGFVVSCFMSGLSPTEFFFHSMGGRESLVNTAIRTARSGYMQRRLINALQDLVSFEDLTVRDSRGVVVQFTYGGDGADPQKLVRAGEEVLEPERE